MQDVPLPKVPHDPRDPHDKPDDALTFGDLERLEASDDPADRERAERILAEHRAMVQEAVRGLTGRLAETAKAFQNTSLVGSSGKIRSIADDLAWHREEEERAGDELRRVMAAQAARKAKREAQQDAAASATIETVQLLEALVAVSNAQQAHMNTMAALLDAIATQSALASQTEEERWTKLWPLNQKMLFAARIAAVAAIVSIFLAVILAWDDRRSEPAAPSVPTSGELPTSTTTTTQAPATTTTTPTSSTKP